MKRLEHSFNVIMHKKPEDDVVGKIYEKICEGDAIMEELRGLNNATLMKIGDVFKELYLELFDESCDPEYNEALQRIAFDRIHDLFLPTFKAKLNENDTEFFEKCKKFCENNISAEQFGADENHAIPLKTAVVELSVLDRYKSPMEKMDCLCTTYDLVFAELKTAIVSVISKTSEKENEIPVVNNSEIIPILMVVIIRSKLRYFFTNLVYVKFFYHKMESKPDVCHIYKAFETASNLIKDLDVNDFPEKRNVLKQSISLEEFMAMTASDPNKIAKTLLDEENQRTLDLITKSTSSDL